MRSSLLHAAIFLAVVAGAPGCGRPDPEDLGSSDAWLVDTVPELELGAREGDVLVSVTAAVRLPIGRIVVADAGAHQLRLYERDGTFLRAFGREGRGPGEFVLPAWVGTLAAPDTFAVWDPMLRRISVFTESGLDREVPLNPIGLAGMFPEMKGVMADGSFVVGSGLEPAALGAARDGVLRDSVTLLRVGADGKLLDTLTRVGGPEVYRHGSATGFATTLLPFGRATATAVGRKHLYLAETDAYRVLAVAPGENSPRTVLIEPRVQGAHVGPEDVARWRAQFLAQANGNQARVPLDANVPSPKTMPVIGRMVVEPVGRLWVEDYAPWPDRPATWTVWEPSTRRRLARGRIPAGVDVLQVEAGYLLGRRTDEDGIHRVVLYRLAGAADF
jgi:hypothetical protein